MTPTQGSLFEVAQALTCALGEPWLGSHPLCDQEAALMAEAFTADVARGLYDTEGYTVSDRKRLRRRA